MPDNKGLEKEPQKNDRVYGFFRVATEDNGTVHRFDMDTGEEISLLDMDINARKDHFNRLFEIIKNRLPDGISVSSWLGEIKLLDEKGDTIGELKYAQTSDSMKIRDMKSGIKGGGKLLLLQALIKQPETCRIYSSLVDDNGDAYRQARSEHNDELKALRNTPAYRNRAFCGFNGIVENESGGEIRPQLVSVPLPTS
ncbi:MAG: hypothetical protein ABID45_03535 [Patescibacteria group bacterium]